MVQFAGETNLDARALNDRAHLADFVPSDLCHVCLCICTNDSRQASLAGFASLWHQPDRKPCIHADPVWSAKFAACSNRHRDRVGHDPLDDLRYLEALQMGRRGPSALFNLGLHRDSPAIKHHD